MFCIVEYEKSLIISMPDLTFFEIIFKYSLGNFLLTHSLSGPALEIMVLPHLGKNISHAEVSSKARGLNLV